MKNNFINRQNDEEKIKLLRASSYAYANAKLGENIITVVLFLLSIAYPILYVLSKDEETKLILFQVSFFLAVFVQVLSPLFKGNTFKGALLKEEFDTTLFGLPWKSTLKRIDPFEISILSNAYKGKEIKDWYATNIANQITEHIQIAICQRCNTAYDIELRKKYSSFLFWLLILYTISFAILIISKNIGGISIFLICFSIISFYTHIITIIRGHKNVIEKRSSINKVLDSYIFNEGAPSKQELRDIQDEIFLTRQENAKVPNLFFKLWNKKINRDIDDFIIRVNRHFVR